MLSIVTTKTEGLYCACSPEWGVVAYGGCRDEALNNLQDEMRLFTLAELQPTGEERNRQ
jgi:predicted RNase H-like HicB family nuclease